MTASLRILYVDDDPDIRTIVGMALALDPAIVATVAASGAAALGLVDGGLAVDVAVLDVMMPDMTGPALMVELRGRDAFAAVPILFMTAKAREADVAGYRAQGAAGVILKPFDPLDLARRIRTLIGRSDP